MAVIKPLLDLLFIMLCLVGILVDILKIQAIVLEMRPRGTKFQFCDLQFPNTTSASPLVRLHCRSSSVCSVVRVFYIAHVKGNNAHFGVIMANKTRGLQNKFL